ncbi:MAG: cysteine desulfurase family protein [Bacteroidetes bacterium]|nr:cysteine desulfurase family protein [Bacteroidota bacterium]
MPESTYLDHAATSPVLPEVLDAMMPWLTSEFGNPSAVYGQGRRARHALESARSRIAGQLGVGPAEIVFTSGASESNNTVLGRHVGSVVTSAVEHEAVLEPVRRLPHHRILSPDASGRITVDRLAAENVDGIHLASFMLVNNEIGTINPVTDLAAWCRRRGWLVHTDAAQAVRTVALGPVAEAVDYLSLTGHKFGAPKGIGILMVKAGVPHHPLIRGGGQEQERRSGTENVAFAVGLATALDLAVAGREAFVDHCRALQHRLYEGLKARIPERFTRVSPSRECSPHINNLLLLGKEGQGLDGEMLILGLDMDGIAASAGSACSSGTMKTSHVLSAIGIPQERARAAVRISFGPQTRAADVDRAVDALSRVVGRMVAS